ncbi:MAG TPA: DUF4190 domain-containing protein [Myxococcus sp.]|jgi:hypothetical protein|nr:DUF4190 domain-containing protein [Myxococcus sp.]
MNAQPLSDIPAAQESRCSVHPGRSAVGACARCGTFYCEEDQRELHGKVYCAACAARPDVDYLEGLRLEFWGKRDVWAWLVGLSALGSALGALPLLGNDRPESLLLVLFGLASATVSVCFWLGLPWARLGFMGMRVLGVCIGFVTMEWMGLLAFMVPLIFGVMIFGDTRNKLFFKEEVSREELQAAWSAYKDNTLARSGLWSGVVGLLIPGVCLIALVCSFIGLRRVDPHGHPPIGRKGQAIAGLILGSLGTLFWGFRMADAYLGGF